MPSWSWTLTSRTLTSPSSPSDDNVAAAEVAANDVDAKDGGDAANAGLEEDQWEGCGLAHAKV